MKNFPVVTEPPASAASPGAPPDYLAYGQLAEEVAACLRAGAEPNVEALAAHYPQWAAQIHELVGALVVLHQVIPESQASVSAGAGSGMPVAALGQLGDFRIVRQVGRGGMGVVYEAEQVSLGRRVALKVLPFAAALDAKQLQRFKNEAQAAAHLHHSHIVPVYAVGCERGVYYYAMQFIDGQTLAAVIQQLRQQAGLEAGDRNRPAEAPAVTVDEVAGSPPPERTLETTPSLQAALSTLRSNKEAAFFRSVAQWGIQAAEALEYAHEQGVVHRDIKPANLLLDGHGHLWITDFGLAHIQGETQLTLTGELLGTLRYMSPEQALAKRRLLDQRTDIYSLGVTLYEVLTLEAAFPGRDRQEVLQQIASKEPRRPRRLNPALPADLETICLKAMAKEPGSRYQTAGELAADLRRFLEGMPIQARPVGPVERLWRWCRRNPAPAAASMLAVVALAALTTLAIGSAFTLQLHQEQGRTGAALLDAAQQRDEADKQRGRAEGYQRQAERAATLLTLERGRTLAEQGNTAPALLWLSRSLEMAPEHAADLRRASRASLSGWYREVHPLRAVLPHQGFVNCLAFSPDGKLVATGSQDFTARIWDVATGQPVGRPLQHRGQLRVLAFSPDGKIVATGGIGAGDTGEARLWDVATGQPLGPPLQFQRKTKAPHGGIQDARVHVVVFSPDGKTLLTGSFDGTARLWEVPTGKPLGTPMEHRLWVWGAAFSPNGKIVATGSQDEGRTGEARLWDAATGKPLGPPWPQRGMVWQVAFSPDGKSLAIMSVGKDSGEVRLWDVATGRPLDPLLRHPRGAISSIAFSPDGKTLVTGGGDGTVRLWETATGKPLTDPLRHGAGVGRVAFSPDGTTILATSGDGIARLWDVATGQPHGPPLQHRNPIFAIAFSPDGKTVVTGGGFDNTARLWQVTPDQPQGLLLPHQDSVSAAAFSPDGKMVVTGSMDKTVRRWDTATGKPIGEPLQHPDPLWTLALSPDGKRILTVIYNDQREGARLWDAGTGQLLFSLTGHEDLVEAGAFSPDGKTLLTGSSDKTARLWEAATGKPIGEPMRHQAVVGKVAFSPDGKMALTASDDKTVRRWEAATGKPLGPPLQHPDRVTAMAFSPDGQSILTGAFDGTARLWGAVSGQPLGPPMRHEGAVNAVAFSPDGQTVLTGSHDKTARLWEAATGKPLGPPLPHEGLVLAVAFSPDGKTVLTGSHDRTAQLWEAATGVPFGPPLRHQGSVQVAAFSPDGKTIMTAGGGGARLWPLPTPVQGEVERVKLWTQVLTGLELDEHGALRVLPAQAWSERRQRLAALGGSPVP